MGNNPVRYVDPDGRDILEVISDPSFWAGVSIIVGTIAEDIASFGAGIADDPLTLTIGTELILGVCYSKSKVNEKTVAAVQANIKGQETSPNRLVIQIQNCSKGNSQETVGTSGTQYGNPHIGVTKIQALEALELATADLARTNKSMVKSAEFKNAKADLQSKILASGPLYAAIKKNALQTTFEYKGSKYRIDLDSYVPSGNAPNLME